MPRKSNFEQQLATMLADIHDGEKMLAFLRSFLSVNELTQLGTRLAIHQHLDAGKSYEQIQQQLGVSSATISTASQQQKDPAMHLALKLLALDVWARGTAKKIRRLLPFL